MAEVILLCVFLEIRNNEQEMGFCQHDEHMGMAGMLIHHDRSIYFCQTVMDSLAKKRKNVTGSYEHDG